MLRPVRPSHTVISGQEYAMKLRKVSIKNFKAIEESPLDLANFNVIVGKNGSGKSSVLQALHWMFQSGRTVQEASKDEKKGRVVSENEAIFWPTTQYRNAGFSSEYGNKSGTPEFRLEIKVIVADGTEKQANLWIRSAHNAGITVHIPSRNEITSAIRADREISAYIPGLAGIPLVEEKQAKIIVHRRAAAGDANTVLRNVLLLMKSGEGGKELERLTQFVSEVMGEISLRIEFDDDKHAQILAEFQTNEMRNLDPKRYKPLELAGIGFLQVIQIFAYLIYFRPVLLLVDEPDAHLHPATQERLIRTLASAANELDTQVILTTHSPSVVRGLPEGARVIWMREGKVQPEGDTIGRQMMGWGLLDKKVLLLTEDSKTEMLRAILGQWPDLERVVALWPLHGSGKLLDSDGCASLQALLGDSMKIVLHRDRDFMMQSETEVFVKPYKDKGIDVWLTQNSDVESYFAERNLIAAHFGMDEAAAGLLLSQAVVACKTDDADQTCRRKKRHTIRNQPPLKSPAEKGSLADFSDADVVTEYSKVGDHHVVLGKTLVGAVSKAAQDNGNSSSSVFAKSIPDAERGKVATDLQNLLQQLLT